MQQPLPVPHLLPHVAGVDALPDFQPLAVDPLEAMEDNEVTPDKQPIPKPTQPPGAPVRMSKCFTVFQF